MKRQFESNGDSRLVKLKTTGKNMTLFRLSTPQTTGQSMLWTNFQRNMSKQSIADLATELCGDKGLGLEYITRQVHATDGAAYTRGSRASGAPKPMMKQDVLNTLCFQTYCNINSTQRYLFKFICIQTVA